MTDKPPTTVLYPDAFARSRSAGNDGDYHWDWWQPAIDCRGIKPMDVDAVVGVRVVRYSVGGHFLMAETKDEGVETPQAQQDLIDDLVATGLFSVIHQIGKETPKRWRWQSFMRGMGQWHEGGLEADRHSGELFEMARAWSLWAQSQQPWAWRCRLIRAALRLAPIEVWIWLIKFLKERHVELLGELSKTPLGEASIEKLRRDLEQW